MAYNEHWPRWIQTSMGNHFKVVAENNSYPTIIEGIDERLTTFMEADNRVEIRITGPFAQELSKDYWYFSVMANILIHSHMGGSLPNAYLATEMAGKLAEAAADAIPVYKYGIGVDDDQSLIGCLLPKHGKKGGIKVFHFGEIDRENRLRQVFVDAEYKMELDLT